MSENKPTTNKGCGLIGFLIVIIVGTLLLMYAYSVMQRMSAIEQNGTTCTITTDGNTTYYNCH